MGYATDWTYLNDVLRAALGTVGPSKVLLIDPVPSTEYAAKAPELVTIGSKGASFHYLQESGAKFLEGLRKAYSGAVVRQALFKGAGPFKDLTGSDPPPYLLEPPDVDNDALWRMRRDLLGCKPGQPATLASPPDQPLLGLMVLRLRAAGATSEGSYWKIGALTVRVLNAPNTVLHRIQAEFARETAPLVAPDVIVAVGAENFALPSSIARVAAPSIARGSSRELTLRRSCFRDKRTR